jgi:hypothetical protein
MNVPKEYDDEAEKARTHPKLLPRKEDPALSEAVGKPTKHCRSVFEEEQKSGIGEQ